MNKISTEKNTISTNGYTLIEGTFGQCPYATLNYDGDPSLAYCAKYGKIMDGWTVSGYCRGNGGCDAYAYTLVSGSFGQCPYATLNYDGDPNLAYCAKYCKIMDGWTVSGYCRGNGGCDR